ncbi:hypothetical protein BJY04DRAFT_214510 [Aspergillus karnatakaensis]|uniref:uncharacterized protein n=1 Tax=Aspergillus karnatakaensis TaxID=1810916 RepID=UPI003CCDB6FC
MSAERMEEYLWIRTRRIPSASAIAQACCPPAPPKEARWCFAASWPRPSSLPTLLVLPSATTALLTSRITTTFILRQAEH